MYKIIKFLIRKLKSLRILGSFLVNFGPVVTYNIFLGKDEKIMLKHRELTKRFWIRPGTSDALDFYEVVAENGYKIPKNIRPGFIIDLGANAGYTTIYFASRFPKATIIAVEPETSNFELLKANTVEYTNVHCIKSAIWNKKTRAKITNLGMDNKWAFQVKETSHTNPLAIETMTVGELMKMYHKRLIDILLIDIEGSEKQLFTNNYSDWLPHTKLIFIEIHDKIKQGCSQKFLRAVYKFNFAVTWISKNQIIARNTGIVDRFTKTL